MTSTLRHSASVDIYLNINGNRIDVDSCLENTLWIRNPQDIGPCEGELVILVDGNERRKKVFFPYGLSKNRQLAEYELRLAA